MVNFIAPLHTVHHMRLDVLSVVSIYLNVGVDHAMVCPAGLKLGGENITGGKVMKVFLDLDGVLVDFNQGIFDYYELQFKYEDVTNWEKIIELSGMSATQFWRGLNEDFWANLPWTKKGPYVWNYLREYDPIILSTPTLSPSSLSGKYRWILRHIPEAKRNFFIGTPKHLVARHDAILIDDHNDNIDNWIRAGGLGVLFPQPWNRNSRFMDKQFSFFKDSFEHIVNLCTYWSMGDEHFAEG